MLSPAVPYAALTLLVFLPFSATEVPLYSVSGWSEANPCAQSCASKVSSTWSINLRCRASDPASCICTLGPLTTVAGKAHLCASESCSGYAGYSMDPERARMIITEYCQSNSPVTVGTPISVSATSLMSELNDLSS